MKTVSQKIIILLFCLASAFNGKINAQYLINPSLEGPPGTDGPPFDWYCLLGEEWSNPNFFEVYNPPGSSITYTPVDSNTFTLYRSRGTTYAETFFAPREREYSYQQLQKPLEAYSCFKFQAYLAFNSHHSVRDSIPELQDIAFPLKFRVWGGNGPESKEMLLVDSDPISNEEWEQYTFYFSTGSTSYSYILIEVQWDTIHVRPEPYNGMMLIDNLNLEYVQPTDTLLVDTLYYRGDNLTQLNAMSGDRYVWDPAQKLNDASIQSPVITSWDSLFTAYINQGDACPVMNVFHVILNCDTLYPDNGNYQKTQYFKYERNTYLNAMPGNFYSWSPDTCLSGYDIQNPYLTGYNPNFKVTIWDKYNCAFNENFNILWVCDTVYPKNEVVMDTLLKDNTSIQLAPKHGWKISDWTPAIYLSCPSCDSTLSTPEATTRYSIDLEDNFGCMFTELYNIRIELRVPNVITPNDDMINDCLKISGLPENSYIYIYTKEGKLLYSNTNFSVRDCWEGNDNSGKPLETGTYWYVLGNPEFGTLKTGFIFIMR